MTESASPLTLSLSWLSLVLLSTITVLAGAFDSALLPCLLILLSGCIKAWLIVDRFMELRHASKLWRRLLLAWPLTMALAITAGMVGRFGLL